jgi:hypothetical protein
VTSDSVKVFGCRPHDGSATYTGGRRPKTCRGGNRAGGAGGRRGRYGELSGMEGQQERRACAFWRLARTGDRRASSVTGSLGEDWRGGIGGDAMSLRAPSRLVEKQLRGRAAFQRGGPGVDVMRYRS